MSDLARITYDPAICRGMPVVRGLRYPVGLLLDLLAAGLPADEILDDHPALESADLLAALEFAASTELLSNSRVAWTHGHPDLPVLHIDQQADECVPGPR
ncbi:DUF433 domain-containing protein [Nocardia crassostreae]|uniref:DUF433 domain-containing protein n=1 Tax=Nocardia crassostreae TaxID=53428 RepID=UPI000A004192|nr:DUF433 domain-containing protein [Nocardia crassostreae]